MILFSPRHKIECYCKRRYLKLIGFINFQIKLFNEWYPTWAEEEQDRLVKGITEMDPDFGTKLHEALSNGPKVNGDLNGTNEIHSPIETEQDDINEVPNNIVQEPVIEEPIEDAGVVQDNIPVEIAAAS